MHYFALFLLIITNAFYGSKKEPEFSFSGSFHFLFYFYLYTRDQTDPICPSQPVCRLQEDFRMMISP